MHMSFKQQACIRIGTPWAITSMLLAGVLVNASAHAALVKDPDAPPSLREKPQNTSSLSMVFEKFPLVDSPSAKLPVAEEVAVFDPPRDGSICNDGWRRLMLNMPPVLVRGEAFSGFRFRYEGGPQDDIGIIFQQRPLGQEGRDWGIIDRQGRRIPFGENFTSSHQNLRLCFSHSEHLTRGQEYVFWFKFDFDYPVELRFRLYYLQFNLQPPQEYAFVVKTIITPAGLTMQTRKAHPLSHMGVGMTAVKTAHGLFQVTGSINNSPARTIPLSVGKFITHVDGKSVVDMSPEDFFQAISDPTQTHVVLTVRIGLVDTARLHDPKDYRIQKVFIDGPVYEEALNKRIHLTQLAWTGDAGARIKAARMNEQSGDMKTALRFYTLAAESGDAQAMSALAAFYTNGRVEVDQVKAAHWYLQAAQAGDAQAMHEMGNRYESGLGVKLDLQAAAAFHLQAAKAGHVESQYITARNHVTGHGQDIDLKEATHWFELAALQNHGQAAYELGMIHLNQQNHEEAFKWFRRARDNKYAQAQLQIGMMLEEGLGVPKDPKAASEAYYGLATQDHPEACYRYGMMFKQGRGVYPNARWANIFLLRAARKGHAQAREVLAADGLDWQTMKLPSEEPQHSEEPKPLPFLR